MALHLGKRIAPPRFLAYAVALLAIGVWAAADRQVDVTKLLIGFDLVTLAFLLSLIPLFRTSDPETIGRHAEQNDANRVASLIVSVGIAVVVLGALSLVVTSTSDYSKALVIVTLAMSWTFVNVVYAMHYAHLYYSKDDGGGFAGGLSIPSTKTPDYFDFLHFALILGMTFQTADIDITGQRIRRVSTWHCLEAFVFNIGILAFSINMIASN